ncbi:MAG: transporter substrate-binding domain-containing protein [Aquabacterium sp.]
MLRRLCLRAVGPRASMLSAWVVACVGILLNVMLYGASTIASPAWAQAAPAAAGQAITVVLDDNYPPFVFRDYAGRLQGILVDEWALWEKRTGVKVRLTGMDWARAQVEIQMGRAEVIDTLFKTPARMDVYDFGPPHTDVEVPIYFHESVTGIQGAASLKGFTVGVKEGDACVDELLREGLESFRRYPNYEAVIDAAAVGEVRVFCADAQPASYLLQRKQLEKSFRHSPPLFKGQFHRAVRKGDQAMLKRVEEGFARITPAERREIEERWLGSPVASTSWSEGYWQYGMYGLAATGSVALALAAWNVGLRRRVQARTRALTASVQQLDEARLKAEAAASHLDAMLEAIPDLLFEVDIDGRFLECRTASHELLMMPPEQFLGKLIREVMPAEVAEQTMQALHEAAHKGSSSGVQIRLDLPKGEHWFELSIARKREGRAGRDQFIVLSRDITDRKRAQEALARHGSELEKIVQERSRQLLEARDVSERASRAKSEFLSRMSHELRTPMNAILGFSQLLEMDTGTTPKGKQYVDEILRAGKHLLHLINDVLDLEQVESGRLTLEPQEIAIHGLMAEVVALMKPAAAEHHIGLHLTPVEGPAGRLAVKADAVRVKQIMLNLLSNAVKYNRPGGQVWLDAMAIGERTVRISVRDNGVGIAPRHLPQLFQPFNRLGAEAGPIEGTGIGLSLCQRLAELMQGRIGVESHEGLGSLFWVDLPKADVVPAAAAVTDAEAAAPMHGSASGPQAQPHEPQAAAHAIVLYVEDNPANLELMQQIVARHKGVTLISSPGGRLGLELARAHRPDLILLDIHLPDIDGYTLLGELRRDPATRVTPVIAVTANALPMDVQRIRDAGFDDYVAKPIQVTQMDMLIHERLGSTLAS